MASNYKDKKGASGKKYTTLGNQILVTYTDGSTRRVKPGDATYNSTKEAMEKDIGAKKWYKPAGNSKTTAETAVGKGVTDGIITSAKQNQLAAQAQAAAAQRKQAQAVRNVSTQPATEQAKVLNHAINTMLTKKAVDTVKGVTANSLHSGVEHGIQNTIAGTKQGLVSGLSNLGRAGLAEGIPYAAFADKLAKDAAIQRNYQNVMARQQSGMEQLQRNMAMQNQMKSQQIANKYGQLNTGEQFISDLVANLIPMGGAIAGGAIMAPTGLGAIGSMAPMYNYAKGLSVGQALNNGASYDQAQVYGIGKGAVETGTEMLFKGVAGLPGVVKVGDKVADAIKNPALKKAGAALADVASEGAEEALAEIIDPYLQRATYNEDAEIDWNNVVRSAIMGAVTSGAINATAFGAGNVKKIVEDTLRNGKPAYNQQNLQQKQVENAQTAQNSPEQAKGKPTTEHIALPPKTAETEKYEAEFTPKTEKNIQNDLSFESFRNTWDMKDKLRYDSLKFVDDMIEKVRSGYEPTNAEQKRIDKTLTRLGIEEQFYGSDIPVIEDAIATELAGYEMPYENWKKDEAIRQQNAESDAYAKRMFNKQKTPRQNFIPEPTLEMSERTLDNVSDKNVRLYQQEHPEVQLMQQETAEALLAELKMGIKGGRDAGIDPETRNVTTMGGWQRQQSEPIERMLQHGLTYSQIESGLNQLVANESTTNSKKVEIFVNEALRKGYQSVTGEAIGANQAYAYRGMTMEQLQQEQDRLLEAMNNPEYSDEQRQQLLKQANVLFDIMEQMPTVAENATTTEETSTVAPEPVQNPSTTVQHYAPYTGDKVTVEMNSFLDGVKKRTGREVVIVNSLPKESNGAFCKDDGKIYLDGNALENMDMVRRLVAHEVYHSLEGTPEFRKLQDVAMDFFTSLAPGITREDVMQVKYDQYAKHDEYLDEDGIYDELAAEFMEYALEDPAIAEKMWAEQPTLAQRILEYIKNALESFRNRGKLSEAERKEQQLFAKAQRLYSKGIQSAKYQGLTSETSGTRHMFAGELSLTADREALARAKELEASGTDMETIRQETGWFKSIVTGNKWAYEISDKGVRIDRGAPRTAAEFERREINKQIIEALDAGDMARAKQLDMQKKALPKDYGKRRDVLGDWMSHPELYEAYPELRDMGFVLDETMDANGVYARKQIRVNSSLDKLYRNGMENVEERDKATKTMLHEVQHAVQDIEGFPKGSSPEYWSYRKLLTKEAQEKISDAQNKLNAVVEKFHKEWPNDELNLNLAKRYTDLDEMWWEAGREADIDSQDELAEEMEQIDEIAKSAGFGDLLDEYFYAARDLAKAKEYAETVLPYTAYQNTAGEIMARDTAQRRFMDAEQRKQKQPAMGDENTVYVDYGDSYSIDPIKVREKFSKQVDEVLSGKKFESSHLLLGKTPKALKYVGFPNFPVFMTAKHVYTMANKGGKYKNTNYHGMGADLVKQLPEAIERPLLIAESNTRDDSVVLLTKLQDKQGQPVIAAVKFKGNAYNGGVEVEANLLASAYGKKNVNSLFTPQNILYVSKKESSLLGNIPGLQLPNNIATMNFDKNVAQFRNKVKSSMNSQKSTGSTRYSLSTNKKITTGSQRKELLNELEQKRKEVSAELRQFKMEPDPDETRVYRFGKTAFHVVAQALDSSATEADYNRLYQKAVDGGYAEQFRKYEELKKEIEDVTALGKYGTDSNDKLLTKQQAEYFENSIVVDDYGRPLVVYHGSPNKFYEFDWERVGRNGTQEGRGFYFTDNQSIAEQYINSTGGGAREFYLRMEKPLDGLNVTLKKPEIRKLLMLGEEFMKKKYDDDYFFDNFGNVEFEGRKTVIDNTVNNLKQWNNSDVDILYDIMNTAGIRSNQDTKEFMQLITKKMGYDGVYTEWSNWETGEVDKIYVTFDSNNAKLTDNENPTDSPDIRYSIGQIGGSGGKSRYQELIDKYGSIKPGENPNGTNRNIPVPKQTSDWDKTRQWTRTAMEAEQVEDITVGMIADDLTSDMQSGRFIYEPTSNREQVDRANRLINQTGWEQQKEQFRNKYRSGEAMTADDIALGERLIQEAQRAGDYETAVQLIADVAAIGTEAGRSVQALKILKRLTPEGQVAALKRIEQRINGSLTAQGKEPVALPGDIAQQMLQARGSDKQAEIWDEAIKELANQVPATLADKVNAWRYLAMLSNPKTHIRNMVGNATMRTVMSVKNLIQTGVETALSPLGIERTAAIGVPKEYREFAKWDYENNAKQMLAAGGGRYNDEIGLISQNKRIFNNRALEGARKFNSGLLDAEDMIFKKAAYIDAMSRYMYANGLSPSVMQSQASKTGATYEQGQNFAVEQAKKATFQEASKLAQKLAEIENMNSVSKIVMGAMVPFKKTPINILKRGFEYSPVGVMNGVKKAVVDIRSGKATPAEAIDALTAGLTGTGIMMLGYFMASNGLLSGGADDDDQRKARYDSQMGSQNYALVFPDGSTYTIDWLAPSVMPLMVGAELQKQMSGDVADSDNATGFTRALEAIAKVGNPVLEMSMMQGVTDALQSYNSGTGQFLSDFAVSSASSYGGQFIPAPVGALARTVDDIVRSSYAPKDSQFGKEGETFLRQQANKLPGVSKSMQPSIDVWGNERKREGDTVPERLLHNMFNPGTYSSNKRTDLDIKLDELYKATGNSTVLPKTATSYIDASEQNPKVYLNSEEYTKFAKTKGQKSQKYVSDFVNSAVYNSLDNNTRADIVADLYNLANYEARKEALTGRSIDYSTTMYENALGSGVEPYEYYATKARFGGKWSDYEDAAKFSGYADRMQMLDDKFVEVYDSISDLKADKDKNGKSISGSRQEKVEKYLNGELKAGNITKEQWWYFWTKEYSSKAKNAPYDWIREANK